MDPSILLLGNGSMGIVECIMAAFVVIAVCISSRSCNGTGVAVGGEVISRGSMQQTCGRGNMAAEVLEVKID